jgi:hypothetical protein
MGAAFAFIAGCDVGAGFAFHSLQEMIPAVADANSVINEFPRFLVI